MPITGVPIPMTLEIVKIMADIDDRSPIIAKGPCSSQQ